MPKHLREFDAEGRRRCAYCGHFKYPEEYNKSDSYCKTCRSQYQREYVARRKLEDPLYLPMKAARLRRQYHNDPARRVARIESTLKYRTKVQIEHQEAVKKGITLTPRKKSEKDIAEQQKIKDKWDDV